jgi:hypothetical protein
MVVPVPEHDDTLSFRSTLWSKDAAVTPEATLGGQDGKMAARAAFGAGCRHLWKVGWEDWAG